MSEYLVKLKPMDSYFFGSERTFEIVEEGQDETLRNNIVKSTKFPQQTSILGMLRKQILIEKNLLREDWDYSSSKAEMIKAIGNYGFSIDNNNDFGLLKRISPVFVAEENGDSLYIMISAPIDHNCSANNEENVYIPLKFNDKKSCRFAGSSEGEIKELFLPTEYKNKDSITNDFMYADIDDNSKHKLKSNSEVFIEDSNIGIALDKDHKTKDGCLFRLIRYKLNTEKCFIFAADIDMELDGHKDIVNLGGEASYFSISFKKVNDARETDELQFEIELKEKLKDIVSVQTAENKSFNKYNKIVLLSDTYLESSEYNKYCCYAISNSKSFRTLNVAEDRIRNRKVKYRNKFDKSKKYNLLKRGSVLYSTSDNYEKLKKSLNKDNFTKIGYNMFIGGNDCE